MRHFVMFAAAACLAAPLGAQAGLPGGQAKAVAKRAADQAAQHVAAVNGATQGTTPAPATRPAARPATAPVAAKPAAAKPAASAAAQKPAATTAKPAAAPAKPAVQPAATPAKPGAAKPAVAAAKPAAATPASATAGAPTAPATGRGNTSVATRGAEGELAFTREVYVYPGAARRDPFVSLLKSGDLRPLLSDLKLVTVLYDPTGRNSVAIMRDYTTKDQYRVKVGQTLGRMKVAQIQPRQVVFTIDEFGYSRQETLALSDTTSARTQ